MPLGRHPFAYVPHRRVRDIRARHGADVRPPTMTAPRRATLRAVVGVTAAVAIAASGALLGTAAVAATPTPAPSVAATAPAAASGGTTADAAATAEPTPASTTEPTAAPAAPSSGGATSDAEANAADVVGGSAADTDPSLAVQDASGNHTMGSSLAETEVAPTQQFRVQSKAATTKSVSGASSSNIKGMDVSGWQTSVNWASSYKQGARFAYVKATENTSYKSSLFSSQYSGARKAGMYTGAYHFAHPGETSGAAQAAYFVNNGGGWSADGKTLPPLLDLEAGCWGLSQGQMISWIKAFSDKVKSMTGITPAIYTGYYWWQDCTGGSKAFSANKLMIANYGRELSQGPFAVPANWSDWTIWQYSSTGPFAGDSSVFNGSAAALKGFVLPSSLVAAAHSPKGNVDQISTVPGGIRVRGWTLDPDSKGSITTHIYVGSKVVSVKANKTRNDVAAQYPSWGAAHGYDTVIPVAKASYKVCAYGINVGTGGNTLLEPCVTKKSMGLNPVGVIDSVTTTPTTVRVKGWSFDGGTASSIKVKVAANSVSKTVTASVARSGVASAYPAYGGKHGFDVTLTVPQGTPKVCVTGVNVGSGKNATVGSCVRATVNNLPRGSVDRIVGGKGTVTVSGWMVDTDTPKTAIRGALHVGKIHSYFAAGNTRNDVGRKYPAYGAKHGFSSTVKIPKGKKHVCVYGMDSSKGKNPVLKCAYVTVK